MKKILIAILLLMLLGLATVLIFPQVLFMSAFGQKIALQMEGEEVARFYFKEDQTSKDTLYMKGVIYSNTLEDITEVLHKNPQVTTLVMEDVPGSIDDHVNLLASREIRKRSINTYISEGGMVASGGTDMFLAGKKRAAHTTAKLGVHSWSDGEKGGDAYPKNDPAHQQYLDYYKEMGIPTDFYWYTLKAAPADSIHNMTLKEIEKYKILTH